MANALRKTMAYLGLIEGAEDEFRDNEEVGGDTMERQYEAEVTPLRSYDAADYAPAAGELRRIVTIHPRSYNDARAIGEAFRDGSPVIINLTDMGDADAKRLVDFSAGLIFGLNGVIERVTSKVFLLSPESVEVANDSAAAADGIHPGFYNQS